MPATADIALRALGGAGIAPLGVDSARRDSRTGLSTGVGAWIAPTTRATDFRSALANRLMGGDSRSSASGTPFGGAGGAGGDGAIAFRGFSLGRHGDLTRPPATDDQPSGLKTPSRAREAAESLVAHALVLPVLKSLRETNSAAPPFAPGAHERTFGAMADIRMADHLVRASRFPLVEAVERWLVKHGGTDQPQSHRGTEGVGI